MLKQPCRHLDHVPSTHNHHRIALLGKRADGLGGLVGSYAIEVPAPDGGTESEME